MRESVWYRDLQGVIVLVEKFNIHYEFYVFLEDSLVCYSEDFGLTLLIHVWGEQDIFLRDLAKGNKSFTLIEDVSSLFSEYNKIHIYQEYNDVPTPHIEFINNLRDLYNINVTWNFN